MFTETGRNTMDDRASRGLHEHPAFFGIVPQSYPVGPPLAPPWYPTSMEAKSYCDFGTLIWPHFGRLIWPHLIYSDRSSYPVPASRDGEGDGQETQGGTV